MQSLRNRQIREILDEDMNINRQVFNREIEQVRVFQENVLPKKTSDIEAEISVDKLIESLNKLLENKLTSLEYLLGKIVGTKDIGDNQGRQSYNNIVNNGDFIIAYNQLVRVYTLPGMSRASQEAIKVKFQEIKPNLDAMVYGLQELIQYLFESGKSDKEIFQLVRSQAVYEHVNKQLYSGNYFKIIDQSDITIAVKEVLSDLSEVQRAYLKDISGRNVVERSLLKLPIEIGDNEERIKQLESELGFNLPRDQLSQYAPKEREQAYSMYGNMGKDIISGEREKLDKIVGDLSDQRTVLQNNLKKVSAEFRKQRRDLAQLRAEREQLLQGQRNYEADEDLKDADYEFEVPLSRDIAEKQQHINKLQKYIAEIQQNIMDSTQQISDVKQEFDVSLKKAQDSGLAEVLRKKDFGLRKKGVKTLEEDAELKEEVKVIGDNKQQVVRDFLNNPNPTREELMMIPIDVLREIALSVLRYTPLARTDKSVIVNTILKKNRERMGRSSMSDDMKGSGKLPDTVKRHNTDYKLEPLPGFDDRRNDIYYVQR